MRATCEACRALRPYVADPRGRVPDKASATHELALHIVGRAYTYNAIDEAFTDRATKATKVAMGAKKLDPRPALRRLRKREKLAAVVKGARS